MTLSLDEQLGRKIRFEVGGTTFSVPFRITSNILSPGEQVFSIKNYSSQTLTDLGIYISAATNLGTVDYPADNPPATDYQDLLMWGTRAIADGIDGGVKISIPSSEAGEWVTRTSGSHYGNKMALSSLAPNSTTTFKVKLYTPLDIASRRLFFDIVVE